MRDKEKRNRKTADAALQPSPAQRLGGLLDIPPAAMSGVPQIELAGNREAVIDGCQGILEYDENVIKLSTGKMSMKFIGRNLQVKVLTHDSAVIDGYISSIEFIT